MKKIKHSIPPEPRLMEIIGATDFTLAEAIVELVANSLDARPLKKDGMPEKRLKIDVMVSPEEVSVIDDASGMVEEELAKAVTLGVSMEELHGHRKRKGVYGLGLKTAAASIGRYWCVITRSVRSEYDYFLEFDLEAFSKRGSSSKSAWDIEIEQLERKPSSILGNRKSGTAIVIKKIRDRSPAKGAVTKLLGDAYSPHIADGDVIRVDGVEAQPTQYTFIDGSRIEFNVVIDKVRGWVARGWVGLDVKNHNAGDYGFSLYRQNQLIEVWDKSWFRAHTMTSRIIGAAHIDFVPTNFNKQGFVTQSEQWHLTCDAMKEYLKDVVRASNDANRNRGDPLKERRAVDAMRRALKLAPFQEGDGEGLSGGGRNEGVADTDSADEASDCTRGADTSTRVEADRIIHKGQSILLSCISRPWSSDRTLWDYVPNDPDEKGAIEVHTILNTNSKLFEKAKDTEALGILAVADCVTRYLVERRGMTPAEARELRDTWVFEYISQGGGAAKSVIRAPNKENQDE